MAPIAYWLCRRGAIHRSDDGGRTHCGGKRRGKARRGRPFRNDSSCGAGD